MDGLRFFAFMGVFVYHEWLDWPEVAWGALGVQLFFALSGFLITRILVLHATNSLWHDLRVFYARRALRIFPLYYAVLIVLLIVGRLPFPIWHFLYLQNVLMFVEGNWIGPPHLWSLCVEEQFYLTFPVILLVTPRRYRLGAILLLLAISFGSIVYFATYFPANHMSGVLLPTSGCYLLCGCLAGLCDLALGNRRQSGMVVLCAGLLLLAGQFILVACLPGGLAIEPLSTMLLAVGFSGVVLGLWRANNRWLIDALSVRPLAYLGKISYGLYVYHVFAISGASAIRKTGLPGVWRVHALLAFGITVALAALSWRFLESPINSLKKRFPYASGDNPVVYRAADHPGLATLAVVPPSAGAPIATE